MSIKVLHITTSYRGGAGIAALRLQSALQEQGVLSGYLSRGKTIDFDGILIQDDFLSYSRPSFFKKIRLRLFPSKKTKQLQEYARLKKELNCEIATFPFSQVALEEHPLVQEADVLHLHWVGGILDYPSFFKMIDKPIVWTLHDMNPFMGIFHYKNDALLNKNVSVLASEMLRVKREALTHVKIGALVSPSAWLLEAAQESKVFSNFKEQRVIANGVNTNVFVNINAKEARKYFHISEEEHVLLFVAGALDIYRKGFDLLTEALTLIKTPVTILIAGKGTVRIPNKEVKIVPLGFLETSKQIAAAYSAADVFVLPSREDNLPNTMLESFACGTPIISFANGGMKEHMAKGTNGMLAQEISSKALAECIDSFFESGVKSNSESIRNYAQTHFSFEKQAKEYIDIYNSITN